MSRHRARRHKGAHRQNRKADSRRVTTLAAADTLRYWHDKERHYFVYFIQEADDGPIKIGWAVDPIKRLAELQCGNPRELTIMELILGGPQEETQLHAYWHHAALRGEWFDAGHQAAILAKAQRINLAQINAHKTGTRFLDVQSRVVLQALFSEDDAEASA